MKKYNRNFVISAWLCGRGCTAGVMTYHLTLSLPRVINLKFPLQPHQKYYTAQYEELGFSSLTQMKDDYTTNSCYITYTFSLLEVGRMHVLSWGVKGLKLLKSCNLNPVQTVHTLQLRNSTFQRRPHQSTRVCSWKFFISCFQQLMESTITRTINSAEVTDSIPPGDGKWYCGLPLKNFCEQFSVVQAIKWKCYQRHTKG